MTKKKLTLNLEKVNFIPGEVIRGTVVLDVYKNFKFYGIVLKLVGEHSSHLTKRVYQNNISTSRGSNGSSSRLVHIRESIQIIEQKQILSPEHYKLSDTVKSLILPCGKYSIHFQFVLPHNIPSSFVFKRYANVRYFISANIIKKQSLLFISVKTADKLVGVNLTIRKPSTSNQIINPIEFKESKSFLFSRNKGKMSIEGVLHNSSFYIGGNITSNFIIKNNSNKKLSSVTMVLNQISTISARNSRYSHVKRVSYAIGNAKYKFPSKVAPGESKEGSIIFNLPDSILPCMNTKLFSREYYIVFQCNTCGLGAINITVKIKNISICYPPLVYNNSRKFDINLEKPVIQEPLPDIFTNINNNIQDDDINNYEDFNIKLEKPVIQEPLPDIFTNNNIEDNENDIINEYGYNNIFNSNFEEYQQEEFKQYGSLEPRFHTINNDTL